MKLTPLLLAPLAFMQEGKADVPKGTQPNIIVILTDDMGYSDIGCYGGRLTPNS